MKSFQNKNHNKLFKSLQHRKCNHHKHSLQYIHYRNTTNQKPRVTYLHLRQDKDKNFTQNNNNKIQQKNINTHNQMIKSLIAMNQQYFQDKLQVTSHGKPCKLKLKIPSATGSTVYKKDYIKLATNKIKNSIVQDFKQNKIDPNFFGNTTYRNQFIGQQNSQRKFVRGVQEHIDLEAPAFLYSQYKHNFLNWGASSHMPSMKPHPSPAVTNLPLHPNTVYSTQFTTKPTFKHENLKINNSNSNSQCSLNPKVKQITTPLLYMTTNNMFYDRKKTSKQINLKPKTHTLSVGQNNFKGKTQYQSQFKNSKISNLQPTQNKPLKQLQNMIINL